MQKKYWVRLFAIGLICTWLGPLEAARESIAIFTYKSPLVWDRESVKKGITGSEEAVIYISEELAKLGYQVTVFANPPEGSKDSKPEANPRFVPIGFVDKKLYDIGLVWRMPMMAKELKGRAKRLYLWPHDNCAEKVPQEIIDLYAGVLWLSKWQREQWSSVNEGFAKFTGIFGNGIQKEQFHEVAERENPYACIYGSNYGRGLEVLLDAWPLIKRLYPKATLDIYYGWQHWGLLTKEAEERIKKKIEMMSILDVREHGLVGHEELNRAYAKAAFWTYPCTDQETFCITALRAQAAGAIPVVIQSAALKETVKGGFKSDDVENYLSALIYAMQNAKILPIELRQYLSKTVLEEHTWSEVAKKWKGYFDETKNWSQKRV